MANLLIDFTKGFASNIVPESIMDLKSDAENIYDTLIGGAKTAQDKYREIRNSSGFKKVTDWFFHRGREFNEGSTLEDNDDDFDAGFKFGGDTDDNTKSAVLDADSMKDIMRGQVSSMYQIAGKQTEANAMTASEIITTVNTRSSEIISSLSSINTSLQGISEKLDNIVKIVGQVEERRERRESLFDSSGNLTLGSTFEYLRKNNPLTEYYEPVKMLAGMIPMFFQNASPAEAIGSILGLTGTTFLGSHRFKFLGQRSLDDIRGAIDERIMSAQNNLLAKLFDWDKFKGAFGNLLGRETNKDYGRLVKSQYDREKAVFDNMTRKTIIDIIPGYLRRITSALTGQTLYISPEGSLTTERSSGFKQQFTSTIQDGFNTRRMKTMMSHAADDIDQNDVYMAQRVLVSLYVFYELRERGKKTQDSDFANGGDPTINARAVEYLTNSGGKTGDYWERVIQLITSELITNKRARSEFAKAVRSTAVSTDSRATYYAKNAVITADIGKITDDIVSSTVNSYIASAAGKDDRTWQQRIDAKEIKRSDVPIGVDVNSRVSDEELRKAERERIKQAELMVDVGSSFREVTTTTNDYLSSIFEILNRGINVFCVGERFPKMQMKPASRQPFAVSGRKVARKLKRNNAGGGGGNETTNQSETMESLDELGTGTPATNAGGGNNATTQTNSIQSFIDDPMKALQNAGYIQDFNSLKASTYDSFEIATNKRLAQIQMQAMGDTPENKEDKRIAETVLAAMQTSAMDGDTKEDMGPLMQQISEIHDPKLKSRLTKVVQGTLQRAENKKPAESKLGKILTWGFGLVKTFFGGIFSKAKVFLTTIGSKLLSPIINSLKSAGGKILYGAQSIKEGFFGSDESLGIFGRAKESIKGSIGNAYNNIKLRSQLSEINYAPTQRTNDIPLAGYTEYDYGKGQMPTIELKEISENVKEIKQSTEEQKDEKSSKNPIKKALNSFVENFKKTEFGQGFMAAFEKRKNPNKEMAPQTLADQMTKSIADMLKSKDGNGTIFGKIISTIKEVGNVFQVGVDKTTEETTNNTKKQDHVGMDSIDNEGNATSGVRSETESSSGESGGDGGEQKKKGIGFDIGKIFGGLTSILGGILQAVLTVIASMSGFKAIVNLGMKILKNSLQPLNTVFQKAYKALKPVAETLQKVLKQIVSFVTDIAKSVIDFIQPLIEAFGPMLEEIMETLKPILDSITEMISVLMVPMVAIMQTVVVPIMMTISNVLEQLIGIVQIGLGLIITSIGSLMALVGGISKLFGSGDLHDQGVSIAKTGINMMTTGATTFGNAVKRSFNTMVDTYSSALTGETEDDDEPVVTTTRSSSSNDIVDTLNGSPMDGVYGNGDPELSKLYGGAGANQNHYGNYMNMGQRGCGPIALADAYARRSGSSINAKNLTTAMASSGAYSPTMGTSVAGYMNTSRSLGMNLHAGGVTPASLKYASPHNPITVIGSGTDFTTRTGNNHFMNVIGSSGGTAYVSNPMNGRIERRSITSLAANSVMGLYGSGDTPTKTKSRGKNIYGSGDAPKAFEFSDAVQDALSTLKDLVGGIISLFTGEMSVQDQLDAAKQDEAYKKAMVDVGNLTDEEKTALEAEAFELYKQENPQFEGESDQDYAKRFRKKDYYNRYMTMAATKRLEAETKKAAGSDEGSVGYLVNQALGEYDPETGQYTGGFTSDFITAMDEYNNNIQPGGFFTQLQDMIGYYDEEYDGESGFYSDNGAKLYTDEYTPTVFDNSDAVNWRKSKGDIFDAPLIEWMQHTMPSMLGMSSAYLRYNAPATENVEGTQGAEHLGTDWYDQGAGTEIRATTDGVVIGVGPSGGAGNMITIQDVGGDLHKYMHMRDPGSPLKEGDEVHGGDVLGIVGSTGYSTGPHLHYQIESNGKAVNPYTFFKWREGTSGAPYGPIDFEGQLEKGNIWDYHKDKTGVSKFMRTAFDAGLTGPEVAAITSMGIWEDGGEKLWGDKSLLNTTYDTNGQQAVGLMNWVDTSVDYGDTVEKQLQYIQRTYFDRDSRDGRALVSHNEFDAADLKAYNEATARNGWQLDFGEHYGPYMNDTDLIEGSEHWYRTALVPACIHTVEGPRKYIGTAVGVYNWLLDQGYIDDYGYGANITYSRTDAPSEDITNGAGAGNTEYNNAAAKGDKKSGVPYRYTANKTGSWGTAYNGADQELFDYYVPTGNSMADENATKGKGNLIKYIARLSGGLHEIWIKEDSFRQTHAGNNAKLFVTQYKSDPKTYDPNADGKQIPNTSGTSTNQALLNVANSVGLQWKIGSKDGVPTYDGWTDPIYNLTQYHEPRSWADTFWKKHGFPNAPNWSDSTMGSKFNSIHHYGDWRSIEKNLPVLKMFDDKGVAFWDKMRGYPNTTSALKAAGLPTSQSYFYEKGKKSYNDYYKALSKNDQYYSDRNYYSGIDLVLGAGDNAIASTTFDQGLMNLFTDPTSMEQQPIIVNKYDIPQDTSEVLDLILNNTYSVRSEQIETALKDMLTLMKNRANKNSVSQTRKNKASQEHAQFPEQGIPSQVERLSVG